MFVWKGRNFRHGLNRLCTVTGAATYVLSVTCRCLRCGRPFSFVVHEEGLDRGLVEWQEEVVAACDYLCDGPLSDATIDEVLG